MTRPPAPDVEAVETGATSRRIGAAIVWARWLIPTGWIVGVAAAYLLLPSLSSLPAVGLNFLIPEHAPAIETAKRALQTFRVPALPQIAVVERDPDGLSLAQQKQIARLAVRLDRDRLTGFPKQSFAVPIANTGKLFPGSRERGTTAITYLFFDPDISTTGQRNLARRYTAKASVPGAPALVTGSIPGRIAQTEAIQNALSYVTYATLGTIVVILGLYFRALLRRL